MGVWVEKGAGRGEITYAGGLWIGRDGLKRAAYGVGAQKLVGWLEGGVGWPDGWE